MKFIISIHGRAQPNLKHKVVCLEPEPAMAWFDDLDWDKKRGGGHEQRRR